MPISIWCPGLPVPQGSVKSFWKKGMKYPALTSTSKNLKTWRAMMSNAIQAEMGKNEQKIMRGPVSVALVFHLIKPQSAPKKKVIYPIKRPDLDKLVRAAMDALTGTIVMDDSQVTVLIAKKVWETNGPGVHMEIVELVPNG